MHLWHNGLALILPDENKRAKYRRNTVVMDPWVLELSLRLVIVKNASGGLGRSVGGNHLYLRHAGSAIWPHFCSSWCRSTNVDLLRLVCCCWEQLLLLPPSCRARASADDRRWRNTARPPAGSGGGAVALRYRFVPLRPARPVNRRFWYLFDPAYSSIIGRVQTSEVSCLKEEKELELIGQMYLSFALS